MRIKQEAVVLADELVSAARYKKSRPANYPHGWLDDNGRNEWAEWKTYIQDKENSVWEATLHIATSATGEKFLYDIDPIKMAEQSENSDTSTAQSTPPARGATLLSCAWPLRLRFQSTPPRGGRPSRYGNWPSVIIFQSTPPRGGDDDCLTITNNNVISIHAPARGATSKIRSQEYISLFQSTPPARGATYSEGET